MFAITFLLLVELMAYFPLDALEVQDHPFPRDQNVSQSIFKIE